MISTNYFILTKNIRNTFYTYNLEIGFVEIQEPFRQTVLKTRVLLRYLSHFCPLGVKRSLLSRQTS